MLDARSQSILQLVIEAYVDEAQPVSSSAVARRGRALNVSAATIRAIMADLEAAGYLQQPHTSAGRIPTERGLRLYLDLLMSPKLHPWDRTRLDAAAATTDLSAFPSALGHSLAGLAGQVTVIAIPSFLGSRFREVGLARYDAGRFVAFFISPSGLVQQKLVAVDFDLSPEELQRIQNFLNEKLRGRTLEEVRATIERELSSEEAQCDLLRRRAYEIGLRVIPEPQVELLVDGAMHLVEQPEFADIEKLRGLMRTIEDKRALLKLMDKILDEAGVKVVLGSEHEVREIGEVSCVASAWSGPPGRQAAVTILGPQRMDYGRMVALVDYATQLFRQYWERI